MVHPMLPDMERSKIKNNPSRFVNSGIILALEELEKKGVLAPCLRLRCLVERICSALLTRIAL